MFHAIRYEDPRLEDFRSWLAAGRIPSQRDAETLRIAAGVSCFLTLELVRMAAVRNRMPHRFIVELYIPNDECAIEVARTMQTDGHHTVWVSPAYFMPRIVAVHPMRG